MQHWSGTGTAQHVLVRLLDQIGHLHLVLVAVAPPALDAHAQRQHVVPSLALSSRDLLSPSAKAHTCRPPSRQTAHRARTAIALGVKSITASPSSGSSGSSFGGWAKTCTVRLPRACARPAEYGSGERVRKVRESGDGGRRVGVAMGGRRDVEARGSERRSANMV